jgi:hypothetical protein
MGRDPEQSISPRTTVVAIGFVVGCFLLYESPLSCSNLARVVQDPVVPQRSSMYLEPGAGGYVGRGPQSLPVAGCFVFSMRVWWVPSGYIFHTAYRPALSLNRR